MRHTLIAYYKKIVATVMAFFLSWGICIGPGCDSTPDDNIVRGEENTVSAYDTVNSDYRLTVDAENEVHEIITSVYDALKIKGYDPISQIVGYILSDDPTYITSYNGARSMICKVERDELLEELVKNYIKNM